MVLCSPTAQLHCSGGQAGRYEVAITTVPMQFKGGTSQGVTRMLIQPCCAQIPATYHWTVGGKSIKDMFLVSNSVFFHSSFTCASYRRRSAKMPLAFANCVRPLLRWLTRGFTNDSGFIRTPALQACTACLSQTLAWWHGYLVTINACYCNCN